MTWFKTDDRLPDHRKARSVRKSHPTKRRDSGPFGIWGMAGAWSDDGYVPLEILEDWDDDAFEYAERLVAAGLWHPTTREGEPGYIFHDWADHNPVKNDNDPSSAGSFGNHIRWHVQRKTVEPDCTHCPVEPSEESGFDRPDDRGDIGAIGGESLPSRPVPSRARPEPVPTTSFDESNQIDRFDEFWDVYGKKVDRKAAKAKWLLALRKPNVTPDLLIEAARAYIAWEQTNEGGRYVMGPAKWLLNERWLDERKDITPSQPQGRAAQWMQLAHDMPDTEPSNVRAIGTGR